MYYLFLSSAVMASVNALIKCFVAVYVAKYGTGKAAHAEETLIIAPFLFSTMPGNTKWHRPTVDIILTFMISLKLFSSICRKGIQWGPSIPTLFTNTPMSRLWYRRVSMILLNALGQVKSLTMIRIFKPLTIILEI